jgi:hypothetical protein
MPTPIPAGFARQIRLAIGKAEDATLIDPPAVWPERERLPPRAV